MIDPPFFFFCSGTEISLITVHAHLQIRLGSDRLESRLNIITCSGLVCVITAWHCVTQRVL